MRRILTLAAAALLFGGLPALAQSAGQTIDVGGWKVTRMHNPDGSFKQCNATMTYDDKSILGFAASAEKKVYVVIIEPEFKLTEGQVYKASYKLDGAPAVAADAIAASANTLVIPIASEGPFMDGAMAANSLTIEAGGQTIEEPLDGSKNAINQLGECAVAGITGK